MTDAQKQPKVIVFTTPTCFFCNTAKGDLRQNGVRFKKVDLTKDDSAASYILKRTHQQGVPVLYIGGKIVIGFDRSKINQLLDIKYYNDNK